MTGPQIPGYERLIQIGKGGFSRVYSGEQSKLKRQVAIKVLNFGLSDEADRHSFERECELMGRVSTHPNIVTVHDTAFTDSGQPCIVMAHYPNGSIADMLSTTGKLTPKETLEVGVAIASALEASHRAKVLHCDLKPQNILISEFGQPALGDFGISTFSEERTRTGEDVGAGFTLAYAAPEIVEGASPSVQSDLYSLAATMYTVLAGRRPFYYLGAEGKKPTASEQARRILLEQPASLVDFGVPVELDDVIRSAMAKDPGQRPESAEQFAQSLYEVGRQLGYGTSAPRIADDGALAVPAVVDDSGTSPASPSHVGTGTDQHELTELRANDETAMRVDLPRPEVEVANEPSSTRRAISIALALVGVIAVVAVFILAGRGDESAEPVPAPEPPSGGDPAGLAVLAPPAPRDMQAVWVGADQILVSWSNPAADDVFYEVRLDSNAEAVASSQTGPIMFEADPNDGRCIDLLAVRESQFTVDQVCVPPRPAPFIDAIPARCSAPCTVSLDMSGFEPDQEVTVEVTGLSQTAAAVLRPATEAVIDGNGQLGDWTMSVSPDEAGVHLITLSLSDSTRYRASVTIDAE